MEILTGLLTEKRDTKAVDAIPRDLDKSDDNIVSDGSFSDRMRTSNRRRLKDLTVIVKRLRSNLEFTQSLAEYFDGEQN